MTNPSAEKKLSLLAVLAHPDDESFGMGGTLALYAQRGMAVHLACATRGEVGGVAEEHMNGYHSVAEVRDAELRCAAGKLGLSGVHFLDYRDSGMPGSADNLHPRALAAADIEEVAARVAALMRQLRPQVVVTFDPIGGYKHPDHIAIQKATTQAFTLAGDPDFQSDLPPYQPQKMYYHVFPKRILRATVLVMRLLGKDPHHFGRNGDIDLATLVEEGDFPIHASLDCRSVAERKSAAAACHASQLGGGPPRGGPLGWVWRYLGHKEHYMRAHPPAEAGLREGDLFAGVGEEVVAEERLAKVDR